MKYTKHLPLPKHVRLLQNGRHGDVKTVMARGGWPTIPKGTIVPVIKEYINLYGAYWRVTGPSGDTYDIEKYACEPYEMTEVVQETS